MTTYCADYFNKMSLSAPSAKVVVSPPVAPVAAASAVDDADAPSPASVLSSFGSNKFDFATMEVFAGKAVASRFQAALVSGEATSDADTKVLEQVNEGGDADDERRLLT